MLESDGERIGTGGRALLAVTWVLAFGPFAAFFFNLSPKTNYQWLWQLMPGLCLAFPLAALGCALVLTYRDTNIWTKLWGWAGFATSLVLSWGVYDFHGI
jgi:hypothetical protein